jgi:cation diffusion facilitator CzcD-associated flavoprotein CzcO
MTDTNKTSMAEQGQASVDAAVEPDFEVIIKGAGISGITQLYHLIERGVPTLVMERNGGVGGTWYQNRYPGCRFDTESYTYSLSFSQELLDEWDWKERFSPQGENLRYLNFVVDKFDLRKHIRLNTTVASAHWEEEKLLWRIRTADGQEVTCRIFISGGGSSSVPTLPRIEGRDDFQGLSFHSYYWPHDPVELEGKRVGIIGTGASAVQIIPEIAPAVDQLYVFQRHPNWCAPLRNSLISPEEMADIRSRYDEIFAFCATTPGGMVHEVDRRGFWNVPREERLEFWEKLYQTPGFAIWLDNFRENFTDADANAEFSEFVANKIRSRVKDPELAEKLIPRDHGFGMKRVPMETGYYEAYNRSNVHLVDISDNGTPIERITPRGILTTAREYDLDIIVHATGFFGISGPYELFEVQGIDDVTLKDKWKDAVDTFLGLTHHGFPNFVTIAGPQSNSSSTNYPRGLEAQIAWVNGLLDFVWKNGYKRFEPTAEAEAGWSAHVKEMYAKILASRAERSWFTGYNSNVPGHEFGSKPRYIVYNGGAPKYRRLMTAVAEGGYKELDFR